MEMPKDSTVQKLFMEAIESRGSAFPWDGEGSNKTQNLYFGIQPALSNDINILTVGSTHQEALDAYIKILEFNPNLGPWKSYPITFSLHEAIRATSFENQKIGYVPKSVISEEGVDTFERDTPYGVVDLAIRKNKYPSALAFSEFLFRLIPYLKYHLYIHDDTDMYAELFISRCGKELGKLVMHWPFKNSRPTIYEYMDGEKITGMNSCLLTSRLFYEFYHYNTIPICSDVTSFDELSLAALSKALIEESIFRFNIKVCKGTNDTCCVAVLDIHTLFPSTDLPPVLAVNISKI